VTEQPVSGTVVGDTGAHGLDAQTGQTYGHEEYHGRPVSWVAVTIIVVGFIIGGIALPIGPNWVLFWVGVAIVAIGAIFAASIKIMDDWY
jgi:nitrate/nitrite transporter NarK